MNFTTNPDIDRTHKQGSITASYPALVKTFGQPVVDNGETPYYPCECGDKTQVEWHLEFVDGTIATIYDWKSAVPARLVTRWSIGGHDIDAVMQVKQEMYEKKLRDESVSSSSSSDAGITTVKEFLRRESKDASEEENTH